MQGAHGLGLAAAPVGGALAAMVTVLTAFYRLVGVRPHCGVPTRPQLLCIKSCLTRIIQSPAYPLSPALTISRSLRLWHALHHSPTLSRTVSRTPSPLTHSSPHSLSQAPAHLRTRSPSHALTLARTHIFVHSAASVAPCPAVRF
jgi:hypothetical protein